MSMHIALIALALEPPGNIAGDLALYRRRLFSRLGEASALALPETALLVAARPLPRSRRRWPKDSALA
jgi:hypothetical protein